MKTEMVVTVQGKLYIYPHEAKHLISCIALKKDASATESKTFVQLINSLIKISDMNESTPV